MHHLYLSTEKICEFLNHDNEFESNVSSIGSNRNSNILHKGFKHDDKLQNRELPRVKENIVPFDQLKCCRDIKKAATVTKQPPYKNIKP